MVDAVKTYGERIMLWTRQHQDVLKELEGRGVYQAKKEYIHNKNGNISDYYFRLYDWYVKKAEQIVPRPEGAEYPIWLSTSSEMMLQPVENNVILSLEVDRGNVVLTDSEKWGYAVNYWYVPLSTEDEKKHNEELEKYGIGDESALYMGHKGNFYPLLRSKIIKSWDRIFDISECNVGSIQATLWEIRKEWVIDIIYG